MALEIVILAAGQGTRMKSDLPKVLHKLAGQPLLLHVLEAADRLAPDTMHIVVGHRSAQVKECIEAHAFNARINWVHQHQQLGTGHAVAQALPHVGPASSVLIMAGDVPLIEPDTLRLLCPPEAAGIHLLTAVLPDASGFGRIIRDPGNGGVTAIVEHRDADDSQREIREINTGVMCARADELEDWLSRVKNDNAQGEYYLPDIIGLAVRDRKPVTAIVTEDTLQITGINSRGELASLERRFQQHLAEGLMQEGVGLADPSRIDIRGKLVAGRDCFIDINAVFEQNVELGDGVTIGPNVMVRNSSIGDGCHIEANSVVDNARIEAHCQVGPFARIRPDTVLHKGSRIGNFVEIKKSTIGAGSKVNHLSYIGDSQVGRDVNIGAGVITCNYDGAYKHQTTIADEVFVGSDCQLVAPVSIGRNATIGAGSTITRDVPAGGLTLCRGSEQIHKQDWQRPIKEYSKNRRQ